MTHARGRLLLLAAVALGFLIVPSLGALALGAHSVLADGRVAANVTNAGGTTAAVELAVYNHRTGQLFSQRLAVPPNSTIVRNLTTRLLMAPGCNFVAMRLQTARETLFAMVSTCNTTSTGPAFMVRPVVCADEDWLLSARFGAACAERRTPYCRAWCCIHAPDLCCNVSASSVLRSSYTEDFASASYVAPSTALPWSVYPWIEAAIPLELATDAQAGSVKITDGALVLGCSLDSIRCLSNLNASVSKAISIPQCLGTSNTTITVAIEYRVTPTVTGRDFAVSVGATRANLNNAGNQTNMTVVVQQPTQVVLLVFEAVGGNCSSPRRLAVNSVSVYTACTQAHATEFVEKDTCGICGGPDFVPLQCPTGTSNRASLVCILCSFSLSRLLPPFFLSRSEPILPQANLCMAHKVRACACVRVLCDTRFGILLLSRSDNKQRTLQNVKTKSCSV